MSTQLLQLRIQIPLFSALDYSASENRVIVRSHVVRTRGIIHKEEYCPLADIAGSLSCNIVQNPPLHPIYIRNRISPRTTLHFSHLCVYKHSTEEKHFDKTSSSSNKDKPPSKDFTFAKVAAGPLTKFFFRLYCIVTPSLLSPGNPLQVDLHLLRAPRAGGRQISNHEDDNVDENAHNGEQVGE